jgi:hypothetical protein
MSTDTTRRPTTPLRLRWLLLPIGLAWVWYCHHWPYLHTANEAMRLYFVQAVVETGRPELDSLTRRHGNVPVDRSEYRGHIYMDKAPGASLLVTPLYPLVRALDPSVTDRGLWRFGYLATLVAAALPLLLLLVVMARGLASQGVSDRGTALTVAALATASPLLVYATLFFGHALAAACVGLAFWLLAVPTTLSRRRAWQAGLLLGWAGVTDTPVFVLGALIALYAAIRSQSWEGPWRQALQLRLRWQAAWPVAAGLAIGVAVQLAYNTWTLGHPLRFTYQFKGDKALAAIMQTGSLGFRLPDLQALWGLWGSGRRGLLYHAPWLLAALAGLLATARDRTTPPPRRVDAAAALALTAAYSLFVSGFADWPAGDSPGARHLLPLLPLCGWGLALAWDRGAARPWVRPLTVAALLVGVLLHAPTVATFPYHFDKIDRPVLELAVPLMLLQGWSPSLGGWLGLPGTASFALFVALLATTWWAAVGASSPAPPVPRALPAGRRLVLTALAVVAWGLLLVSDVPPTPGRAAAVGRWQARRMLEAAQFGRVPSETTVVPLRGAGRGPGAK